MRVARSARPDSAYGVSAPAQTFGEIEESIVNPSDFGEIADVNLTMSANTGNYPHMHSFEEYGRKFEKGRKEVNLSNLLNRNKRLGG